MTDRLTELVEFAQANSPFYRELGVDSTGPVRLADLPIVDQAEFWAANTLHDNRLLTGHPSDGLIFKTGGTTGTPRMSWYTTDEWKDMCRTFATGLASAGVRPGDRVANLYYVGELYASFVFTLNVLQEAPFDVLQLPITGNSPLSFTVSALQDFAATVVAGFPTSLVGLAQHVRETVGTLPDVRLILFSGEPFYNDQRGTLAEAFPHATIKSIGYGSVDGGALGAPVAESDDVRVFRAFLPTRIIEVVDVGTGRPIQEPGQPGRLLLTDLSRRLMPMIRYPLGDLGEWVDFGKGTYRLLGRADESARIGLVSLNLAPLRAAAAEATNAPINGFQVVLRRSATGDQLILRIAADVPNRDRAARTVRNKISSTFPWFADQVAKGAIAPMAVEWVAPAAINTNPRTGKALRLIDERPI